MKAKAIFSDFWFKTDKGQTWYKTYFYVDTEHVAFVATNKKFSYGEELTLCAGRDKEGRAILKVAHN